MEFKQHFYRLVGSSFVVLTMVTSSALAEELDNWSFDATTNELTFSLSDTVLPEFFLLAEPPRLVLDIPDTQIGAVEPEQTYGGAVQNIRVAQHTPDQVRVVIELAPDSVLTPDQADIQFDDNNGQRHWRFRPLLADSTVIAASSTPVDPTSTMADVSLSAANLELSTPSTGAILPIDPYASESSNQQVSVPPLEDMSESVEVAEVAEVNLVTGPAADVNGPDVPPMTVPELEVTELDGPRASSEVAITDTRESVLPDLTDHTVVNVEPTVEPTLSTVPQDLLPAAVEPEIVPDADGEPPVDMATTAVATVAMPDDVSVHVSEDATPIESSAADVSDVPMVLPTTETALAPVQQPTQSQAVAEDNSPAWQTIQQPAAERTIMQTDVPAPLTFGQPLPKAH
ncbi:MAG: AMIN domain-containing protein [Cyanobacteria bacterium P01_B01_bin.77]